MVQGDPVVEYLTVGEVETMHRELMTGAGRSSILRDRGALESAVHWPRNAAYYDQAGLFAQAASLMAGIALAHAFEDGNKRLAYAAMLTFLRLNNIRITAPSEAIADRVLVLVNRTVSLDQAIQECAAWLERHGTKKRQIG